MKGAKPTRAMKPLPTKADVRNELQKQIDEYLNTGGAVQSIPRGISGRIDNINPFTQRSIDPKSQTRTPLTHVIKSMEERKQAKPPFKKRPKKRLITDDFGEPLRWVWEDQ